MRGTLRLRGGILIVEKDRGRGQLLVARADLAPGLAASARGGSLDGVPVDFDADGGTHAVRVRPVGEAWSSGRPAGGGGASRVPGGGGTGPVGTPATALAATVGGGSDTPPARTRAGAAGGAGAAGPSSAAGDRPAVGGRVAPPAPRAAGRMGAAQSPAAAGGPPPGSGASAAALSGVTARFHHPYNFLPAPERRVSDPDLGDHEPAGQDRYREDLWTGWIDVCLTTASPLLIPDAGADRAEGHRAYGVRLGTDGRPRLPATSVKGMLRAAFEAATNSRFGVFAEHGTALGFRREASSALNLVPVRLVGGGEGTLVAEEMQFARLPRYVEHPVPYADGGLPQHGDAVVFRVAAGGRGAPRVVAIARRGQTLPGADPLYEGWAVVTNRNISTKRHERVFYRGSRKGCWPVPAAVRQRWRDLIAAYRDPALHSREDVEGRDAGGGRRAAPDEYLGENPGETAWSRHLYSEDALDLHDGSLCYAEFADAGRRELAALFPVSIARDQYDATPADLLHPSLRPARTLAELSPAERVFGWVNPAGPGAWRGSVRVGDVVCCRQDAVTDLGADGLPLAILGQPKPQQARFYVAEDQCGTPLPDGVRASRGLYGPPHGLRGRKVYPHHRGLPAGYWTPHDGQVAGRWREYVRPGRVTDRQNRSVTAWVAPNTSFRFRLHVSNLSACEAGGLLWLLDLGPGHHHRLGGGKPLGFGSVRLDVAGLRLERGRDILAAYEALGTAPPPSPGAASRPQGQGAERAASALTGMEDARATLVAAFSAAVARTAGLAGDDWRRAPWIRAFLVAATGWDDGIPVHYPRKDAMPKDESYEWFVENNGGQRLALPPLAADPGLPLRTANPRGRAGPGRR